MHMERTVCCIHFMQQSVRFFVWGRFVASSNLDWFFVVVVALSDSESLRTNPAIASLNPHWVCCTFHRLNFGRVPSPPFPSMKAQHGFYPSDGRSVLGGNAPGLRPSLRTILYLDVGRTFPLYMCHTLLLTRTTKCPQRPTCDETYVTVNPFLLRYTVALRKHTLAWSVRLQDRSANTSNSKMY